jgi:hypothetical protein
MFMESSIILDYIPFHDYESCIMWHIQWKLDCCAYFFIFIFIKF